MAPPRSVLFLDPYHTASHRLLSESLRDGSRHRVTLLHLPPRKWKWRMRGAALAFEPAIRALPPPAPEILVTTDFLNLPELLAIARDVFPRRPATVVYFHENQLTYPAASADVRDLHFGLVNVYSALAADRVLFNSAWHRDEFLGAVDPFLRLMPDFRPEGVGARIRARSEVLGLPLDLEALDRARAPRKEPWILWNHRWEEDRDPSAFFLAVERLDALARAGAAPDFGLVVAGQTYREKPAVFEAARSRLAHRIRHWGHVASREAYLDLVARCAIVVSTSRHEFLGVSVLEAIRLGCVPLLPRRLVYPEIVGESSPFLYDDPESLPGRLARWLAAPPPEAADLPDRVLPFERSRILSRWDDLLDTLAP